MTTDDQDSTTDPVTDEHDDDVVTSENERIDATRPVPLGDTDEMPVLVPLAPPLHDDGFDGGRPDHDGDLVDDRGSWLHRNLLAVVGAFGIALLIGLALLAVMFAQLSSARSDLDDTRAELETTRTDMERVEAGAALFASQVNGFVEQIDELGPSIDDGLDQAVVGLEEFGSSQLEFTVNIDQSIAIQENFDLQRTVAVPIQTSLPIDEEFDTTITVNGPFGIDIPLDITVPVDLDVPIDLTVDIPIDESIPIDVDVPVKLDVPIVVDIEGTELETLTSSLIEGLRAFQEGLSGLTGG